MIYLRQLAGEKIHKADSIGIRAIDRDLVAQLVERLDRRMAFSLSVTDGHLFLAFDGASCDGAVEQLGIVPA